MSHGMGRHRRRRRGWANSARWAVGAVLAAIIGAKPAPPQRPASPGERVSPLRPESVSPPTTRSECEPEWIGRYDEAQRTHADRAWELFTEGSEGSVLDAHSELPELGWCVDEDGVRAVRPYLVAHEQRQRAQRQRGAGHNFGCGMPAPRDPGKSAESGTPGEWDELSQLIRQWNAQRVPVA